MMMMLMLMVSVTGYKFQVQNGIRVLLLTDTHTLLLCNARSFILYATLDNDLCTELIIKNGSL